MCNDNVNYTSPTACDRVSGDCTGCLYHTAGDACERCEDWFFGDAVILKNCGKCDCAREGTEECDHTTGECNCLAGVEGARCDTCMPDHWGYNSDPPGCTACDCTEASVTTQVKEIDPSCVNHARVSRNLSYP